MLALAESRSLTHKCGSDLRLSTDPELNGRVEVHDDKVCFRCAAADQHERALREKHKDEWFDGRAIYPEPLTIHPPTDEGGDDGATS